MRAPQTKASLRFLSAIILTQVFCGSLFAATRYGLFIGKNNGGSKRPMLKYAHRDAKQLQSTLIEIGNLKAENAFVVIEPDIVSLRKQLQKFSRLLGAKKEARREVFFYYSGHSDERGLLIDNAVLDFAELKKWIHDLPAEVNIVILDSCSSGSLARIKGGTKIPAAMIAETGNHRGTAILASSSSSEDSQESDQIRGSYFTHNLIAGLRGAADLNRDARVSLYEAYTYSYEETLANTLGSRAGPQHPFFDFKVSGYGDLAVSDLKAAGAQIVFGAGLLGTIYIFDSNNRLTLRLNKTSAKPLAVKLMPDKLHIRIFQEKQIFGSDVLLKINERLHIDRQNFHGISPATDEPVRERYNSDFFISGIFGPSFHYFMPSSGTLRAYDLADLGMTGRLMAGMKIRTDTAVYLTGAVSGISNLTKAGAANPVIFNAGAGARYHFYPLGFFIGGSANVAWNRVTVNGVFANGPETLVYASKPGFGIELNAGMEWQIGRNMGLGISWFSYFGTVYGAASSDPRLTADQVQNIVIGLMASLTFF